jgi:7-carboxy-7-deazaguanine synthase
MLKLSEIFCSIQGESTFAGLPCIFIRLAGCNLRCHYCDTTFSYEPETVKSIDQIIVEIEKYKPVNLVEITGGEPLLQEEVYDLFQVLHSNNFQILLETNGSINLAKVPKFVIKIVDVKTPGSGFVDSFKLPNLNYIDPQKDEIKFVLTDRNDYEWSKEFIQKNNLQKYKVLFSAVQERFPVHKLAEWMIEDKLGVRMQLQLHKYIWDKNKRGV